VNIKIRPCGRIFFSFYFSFSFNSKGQAPQPQVPGAPGALIPTTCPR